MAVVLDWLVTFKIKYYLNQCTKPIMRHCTAEVLASSRFRNVSYCETA